MNHQVLKIIIDPDPEIQEEKILVYLDDEFIDAMYPPYFWYLVGKYSADKKITNNVYHHERPVQEIKIDIFKNKNNETFVNGKKYLELIEALNLLIK